MVAIYDPEGLVEVWPEIVRRQFLGHDQRRPPVLDTILPNLAATCKRTWLEFVARGICMLSVGRHHGGRLIDAWQPRHENARPHRKRSTRPERNDDDFFAARSARAASGTARGSGFPLPPILRLAPP